MSTFSNYANGQLADELGLVRAEIDTLQQRQSLVRDELIARDITEAEGERFTLKRVDATRWMLDSKRLKEEMGEDWYTAHCRVTPTTSLRTSVRKALAAE